MPLTSSFVVAQCIPPLTFVGAGSPRPPSRASYILVRSRAMHSASYILVRSRAMHSASHIRRGGVSPPVFCRIDLRIATSSAPAVRKVSSSHQPTLTKPQRGERCPQVHNHTRIHTKKLTSTVGARSPRPQDMNIGRGNPAPTRTPLPSAIQTKSPLTITSPNVIINIP